MSSKVEVNGKFYRPSFNHSAPAQGTRYSNEQVTAQLCESVRNICEDICAAIQETNRLLRKIDRRLSQVKAMRLK